MGVHEVHYAMIVILAMGIGLFAPPFGVGYYGACAIGRISADAALWRIWPYIGALVVALDRCCASLAVDWLSLGRSEASGSLDSLLQR
jgi:TRAP-type C4-dicarboxylate transport system permease large subunit